MRKWFILILSLVLSFCLAACGADHADSGRNNTDSVSVTEGQTDTKEDTETSTDRDTDTNTDMGKSRILIAYFSVPENADISGVDAVAGASIVHDQLVEHVAKEQDAGFRPTLAASVENFEQYEYIFLGFPGGIIGLN